MPKHPDRKELVNAARRGEQTIKEHLDSCPECRLLVDLLKTYDVAGKLPLSDPPEAWVRRAIEIMQPSGASHKVRARVAELIFDSWAMPQPVGVRGTSSLDERRVRFEAEGVSFDLRAERSRKGWAFIGQIVGKSSNWSEPVLEVDSKPVPPDAGALYQWTSSRPPRKISIRSSDLVVHMPELKWRKTRS